MIFPSWYDVVARTSFTCENHTWFPHTGFCRTKTFFPFLFSFALICNLCIIPPPLSHAPRFSAGTHWHTCTMPGWRNPILPGPSAVDSVSIQNLMEDGFEEMRGRIGHENPAQGPRAASSFSQRSTAAGGMRCHDPFLTIFIPNVSCSLSLFHLPCVCVCDHFFYINCQGCGPFMLNTFVAFAPMWHHHAAASIYSHCYDILVRFQIFPITVADLPPGVRCHMGIV